MVNQPGLGDARSGVSRFAQLVAASSQLANKRGFYLGRRSTKIHVAVYRWTSGKIGGHVPGWPGARILLLDHVGAKSGLRRTSPVIYVAGDVLAIAASKAGQPSHPAWFHNLNANPETTVQIGPAVRRVRARVATDHEREKCWTKFLLSFPSYAFYERNAKGRKIPVMILDPRE